MAKATTKQASFEFASYEGDPYRTTGTVLIRDGEMVLELFALDDSTPYVIVGKETASTYRGTHRGKPGDAPVKATWTRLEDFFIGVWIEEKIEYLFRFTLTKE